MTFLEALLSGLALLIIFGFGYFIGYLSGHEAGRKE